MLHVITAVHNRRAVTGRFVDCLKRQACAPVELILVDDGSTDGTADMVKEALPGAVILKGNGNLWWGGALHLAYQYVKRNLAGRPDDLIMIANDDIEFPADYFTLAVSALLENPRTLISGCGYGKSSGRLADGAYKRDFTHLKPESDVYEPAYEDGDVCSSRSLFFTVKDFLEIGGFHPVLLPHYASDYEWTARATRKGFRIKMIPALRYTFDDAATGDNFYDSMTLKKALSRRSASNPLYKLTYILLSTPRTYLFSELRWQARRYLEKKDLIRRIVRR